MSHPTIYTPIALWTHTRTHLAVLLSAAVLFAASACRSRHEPTLLEQLEQFDRESLADTATNVSLPLVRHGGAWFDAPIVKMKDERVLVDEVPSGPVSQLETEPRELLDTLRNRAGIWRQLNPSATPPGDIIVAVQRDLPGATLLKLEEACAKAGYPHVFVAAHDVSKGVQPVQSMSVVRLLVDSAERSEGIVLRIAGGHAATLVWDGGSTPVEMNETRDAAGTVLFPGVWAALEGRSEIRVLHVEGADRLTVQQIVGLADTMREHGVGISLTVH